MESKALKEKFKSALMKQLSLLEMLEKEELNLQSSVIEKDWPGTESCIKHLETLSERVMRAERRRHELFNALKAALKAEDDEGFYDVIARFPEEERRELSELYRKLKVAVLKVQSLNGGIDTYIRSAAYTLGKVLDEYIPSRRNKTYSRSGRRAGTGEGPLFISKQY
jgi:flagellar biosynthesis/type III secretory pathway chaperone